jgi:hypothetical protein
MVIVFKTQIVGWMKKINKEDDCGCGKSLKVKDPRRKKVVPKRTIKKKTTLK